jgi:hypothetical protein
MNIERVSGIMYCHKHDDFAIEGYDWSDMCHEAYVSGAEDDTNDCDMTPMYVEHRPTSVEVAATKPPPPWVITLGEVIEAVNDTDPTPPHGIARPVKDGWDVLTDVLESVRLADDTGDKHVYAEVNDYIVNHYGDDS